MKNMKTDMLAIRLVRTFFHPAKTSPRFHPRKSGIAYIATLIVSGLLATSWSALAQTINLGAAGDVTILGASTVTNTGATSIIGNLALSPGSSVIGFPPGVVVNGMIHINDALANQAHADAFTAYNQLVAENNPLTNINLTGMNLGGMLLSPGIYHFDTSAQLTGTLRLDTGGDPNAAFHFLIGSTLTTATGSMITLLNGGSNNVFWQVGSSATIGTGTKFVGNIIALTSITLTTGATLDGKALAINGAVTLDTNLVNGQGVGVPGDPLLVARLLAPEELAAIYEIKFALDTMQGTNLIERMDDIRAGSNGFCAAGYAPKVTTQGYSKDFDGKTVVENNSPAAFVPAPENRWGVFVTGAGEYVNVGNEDDNVHGYEIKNGSVIVGLDYRLLQNFAVGVYGGYETGRADLVDDGRLTMDGGNGGVFATYFSNGFYVDVAGGAGWNSYDTRRTALLGDARGSTDGYEINALGAIGYDWKFGCLNIGPTASVRYTNVHIDQFTETGSFAPLEIQDQSEDSLRSTAGFRASYDIKTGSKGVIFRPEVRAAWLHEYNDQAYPIDARLASGGSVLTAFGPTVGRDAAQIRAGVSAQLSRTLMIYAYYDGLLGRSNYESHGASAGFLLSF
jgi:outer membrane autotransporter protein